MFQSLANYLLGSISSGTSNATTEQSNEPTPAALRLSTANHDDDWILVDRTERDSEGNSEGSSDEEDEDLGDLPMPALTRASSTGSIPAAHYMEESWFITPPPCFTSAGPVHMETSPLENLLIEHPSMSVYQRYGVGTVGGRWRQGRAGQRSRSASPRIIVEQAEQPEEADAQGAGLRRQGVVIVRGRCNRLQIVQREEKERRKGKHAQKIQAQKAFQALSRAALERTNKAREVRNRQQRRGERSQGARRSFANNNRKCC